jgi:hypothetical protein
VRATPCSRWGQSGPLRWHCFCEPRLNTLRLFLPFTESSRWMLTYATISISVFLSNAFNSLFDASGGLVTCCNYNDSDWNMERHC